MIGKIIKEITEGLSEGNYFAMGTQQEFNVTMDDNDLFPVVLFINELVITDTLKASRVFQDAIYPIEILFLNVVRDEKGNDVSGDPTGAQLEEVFNNMIALAREFDVRMMNRQEFKDSNSQTILSTKSRITHVLDTELAGILYSASIQLKINYDYCKAEC